MTQPRNGIEKFIESPPDCRRAVFIGNASIYDRAGVPVYRVLKEVLGKRLSAVWSLQHGFFHDRQDNMLYSPSFYWPELDLPVLSLYAATPLPADDWLDGVDLLITDLHDVGTRVYTYLNHLLLILRHLDGRNLRLLVLDRANPLNGVTIEGNRLRPDYFSMVGQLPLPMRHGLTPAEFLLYGRAHHKLDLEIEVLKVRGWRRDELFRGPWAPPSPNLPDLDSALLYPGAVMLEGTNLSEGRGTTRPFHFCGAPFLDGEALAREMGAAGFPGVEFRPVFFTPEFNKYAGRHCRGLLFAVSRPADLRSFALFYELLRLVRKKHPADFRWNDQAYEFEKDRPAIDLICGSDRIRLAIEADCPFVELTEQIRREKEAYLAEVRPYLLY